MRQLSVYIETSVWGMLANDEPVIWKERVNRLFSSYKFYDFYISPVVLDEIEEAPNWVKEIVMKVLKELSPTILPQTEEIEYLVVEYIDKSAFSENQYYDATHVAYASVNDIDILASFNYKHIVRYDVKNIVKSINILRGYHTPDIVSPMQLIKEA